MLILSSFKHNLNLFLIYLGKCYESITENFIPRPRRPRINSGPETPEALVDVQNEKSSMPNKTIDENQNTHKHETVSR